MRGFFEHLPDRRRKSWKILYFLLPFGLAALTLLLRRPLLWVTQRLPACPFYRMTGLYCPGCGNTRSLRALLNGDILLSLRCNILPLVLLAAVVLLFAEWGALLFGGKPRRLLPRSARFWVPFGVLILLYWIGRNFFPLPPMPLSPG